ncbi:MAG: hypothetical protein IJR90_03550, partial [Clostridia bacterium]|nr:hypothetical protein [Clostridia bacterium]
KPGDTGIVKTQYGYHVIYFVGDGDTAWKSAVRDDLLNEDMNALVTGYAEKYEVSFDRELLYKISGFTAYSKEAPASSKPAVTTGVDDDTTAAPDDTAADPGDTTAAPDDTATDPDDTATDPDDTTAAPDDTAAAPDDTVSEPSGDVTTNG